MSTRYVFQTTIMVTVTMADEGEVDDEGEVMHYTEPDEQAVSAQEWAEQAMPLTEDYAEEWVTVDAPPLALVKMEPAK